MRKRIKRNHPRTLFVRGWFYDLKKYKLLAVVFVHDLDEVNNLVAVTDLVVIPCNNLNELFGELNTCVSIED